MARFRGRFQPQKQLRCMLITETETVELGSEGLQGLTGKQFRFATLVFQGLTAVDAYRQVYDVTDPNAHHIGKTAHQLLMNPKVQAKLGDLRAKVDEQSTLAPLLSRELILNGILKLAKSASKEAVQLNAWKLLGQTVGIDLFRETVVTERRQRSPEEIDLELRRRLDELAITIDGQANHQAPAVTQQQRADRRRKPAK